MSYPYRMYFTAKDIAHSILGTPGRAISGYPALYRQAYPENTILFNIVLCTEEEKLWQGDLDLTKELTLIRKLANEVKQDIYLLESFRARTQYDLRPDITSYIVYVPYQEASRYMRVSCSEISSNFID